jgi:hypothetical protein
LLQRDLDIELGKLAAKGNIPDVELEPGVVCFDRLTGADALDQFVGSLTLLDPWVIAMPEMKLVFVIVCPREA